MQVFAIVARELGLIGRPIQSALRIQVGEILLRPDPGSAIVLADTVGPGTGMTVGAVIDQLPVAMDSVYRRVGKLVGDLRSLLPRNFRSPPFSQDVPK